jgi:hypothetical protein
MPFKDSASTAKVMKCRMEHEHGHGKICKEAVVSYLNETDKPEQTGPDPWQRVNPNTTEGSCRYSVRSLM